MASRPLAVLAAIALGCGYLQSDESILRREFAIPRSVRLVEIESSPESPGWFGREGLDIWAVFAFTGDQFETFLSGIEGDPGWQPLPLPDGYLEKLFGLSTYRRSLAVTQEVLGRPMPPPGSVANPSDDQLLEKWGALLPLEVENGLFSCRTAGDDIMHSKRVPCSEQPGDLNDFMFAVLDMDAKQLKIRVKTSY
jgi:hypothetical protein